MGVVLSASHALIPLTNRKAAVAEINIITQKIKIAKIAALRTDSDAFPLKEL